MDVLLTNDDGYDAPGLHAAFEAIRHLGRVHVVAPLTERSSCGHAITTGRPIRIRVVEHEHFGAVHAVDGTPADCVRLAHGGLIPAPIDLVVSGINRGANTGVDVYYSGTVAAAREAALLGHRALAVSQAVRIGIDVDWPTTTDITRRLVERLLTEALPGPGFWSINYPAPIPENPDEHIHRVPIAEQAWPIHFERQDGHNERSMSLQYAVPYWERAISARSDYTVIRDGGIAVSAVPLFCRF
jgi:5'-nucleotidase